MTLIALSIGQLVLTSASTIISIAVVFFSVLNSLWVNTAAGGLTVLFHITVVYRATHAIRCVKKDKSKCLASIVNTTWGIAIGTFLASMWMVCVSLSADITVAGPTFGMGTMLGASDAVVKAAAIRQLVLTAVESVLMVAVVVFAVLERKALKTSMEETREDGYDYPVNKFVSKLSLSHVLSLIRRKMIVATRAHFSELPTVLMSMTKS
jgi:hypothetical protein